MLKDPVTFSQPFRLLSSRKPDAVRQYENFQAERKQKVRGERTAACACFSISNSSINISGGFVPVPLYFSVSTNDEVSEQDRMRQSGAKSKFCCSWQLINGRQIHIYFSPGSIQVLFGKCARGILDDLI